MISLSWKEKGKTATLKSNFDRIKSEGKNALQIRNYENRKRN